jgi:endoribonuclease Dicer
MPLTTISYDLLSSNNGVHLPSLGLLFQAITDSSAQENCNMKSLATLGDSFLKLVMSMSVYHRYPLDDTDVLTEKRSAEISNKNLYHISDVKGLSSYLNTVKTDLHGKRANWIPPGFTVDKENTENHATQTTRWKVYADMIEALIAAFLISTDYPTTIKFMKWLGLDVIPLDEQSKNQTSFVRNS